VHGDDQLPEEALQVEARQLLCCEDRQDAVPLGGHEAELLEPLLDQPEAERVRVEQQLGKMAAPYVGLRGVLDVTHPHHEPRISLGNGHDLPPREQLAGRPRARLYQQQIGS
jgi:hypothetical protein